MKHLLSYWEKSILLKTFDFIVLGGGIIGKQIAIKIKEKYPNARLAIVDKSPLSYGASTRNAGFVCFGSVSEIIDDFTLSPQKDVLALAHKRLKGIRDLINTFGAENIGYRNTGSYEIFEKMDTTFYDKTLSEMESINYLLENETGLKNIFTSKETYNLDMNVLEKCIFNPYEGMLNSGMLNETINAKAHNSGAIPMYGLNVSNIQHLDNGYTLETEQGISLNCNQLILATNAFTKTLVPEIDVVPARGQIILTKPMANIPFDGIFHADKGYIYFRNIDNRILLGGGRNYFKQQEETFDFTGSEELKNHLIQYLKQIILPNTPFEIDMHWSGIMAMGKEKLPIVKRQNEHLILCVRMSGMGVALGPIVSSEVLELM